VRRPRLSAGTKLQWSGGALHLHSLGIGLELKFGDGDEFIIQVLYELASGLVAKGDHGIVLGC
jgi:hypothetical protein